MTVSKEQWNQLCDVVLNGILTLKGLVVKMEHRCEEMEAAVEILRDKDGNNQTLKGMIKRQEGRRLLPNGRHKLYKCPADKWTLGWGRNVEDNGISGDEAELMLANDIRRCQDELAAFLPARFLSETQYNALISMLFNLGLPRFMSFKKMLRALRAGDIEGVVQEMLDSKWARDPATKSRAKELAEMFK